MSTSKRVIIFDRHIVSWSGHWMQFAIDLAELYRDRNFKPVIVVNRKFGKGAFRIRKSEVKQLNEQATLMPTLHQPVFFKKKHPYEKLRVPRPSGSEKLSRWFQKPGSLRPIIYFAISDFRNGDFKSPLQFIQFLTRQGWSGNIGAIGDVFTALFGALVWLLSGKKVGKEFQEAANKLGEVLPDKEKKELKPKKAWEVVWERLTLLRKQERGYREAFERLNPGSDDEIIFQTAELQDLVAIERIVDKNNRWCKAKIKLILRTPIWDREGNMLEPPEDTKLLRQTLLQLQNHVPRLEMYVDTEELVDQFEGLGFRRVRLVPILFGRSVAEALDGQIDHPRGPRDPSQPINALRSGSAQREKGFLVMPDLIKATQVARLTEGLPKVTFTVQATMLRFQRRWDALHATINRLQWFNDADIKVIRNEVSTPKYIANLLASDVILSPNRSVPYTHGSTGTTIEAVRAGRPLVTLGENWGARQVRDLDLYNDHIIEFARKTAIETVGDAEFVRDPVAFEGDWRNLDMTWRPYCHVQDWQIALDVARRIEIDMPPGATEIVVTMENSNHLRAGDVAKVGMQMHRTFEALHADRAQRVIYEYADPTTPQPSWRYYSGGRKTTAAVWKLRPGTRAVRIGLVLLDRRAALDQIKVSVSVCANARGKHPVSAAAYMADTPFEVSEGLFEVVRHIEHYRQSARLAGLELRKFHNQDTFWTCFTGKAARRFYPEVGLLDEPSLLGALEHAAYTKEPDVKHGPEVTKVLPNVKAS